MSNYTPSYIEDPGLSSNALFADPIFLPAAELLANNEDLLEAVYQINATLVYSLNTGESSMDCPLSTCMSEIMVTQEKLMIDEIRSEMIHCKFLQETPQSTLLRSLMPTTSSSRIQASQMQAGQQMICHTLSNTCESADSHI